MENTTNINDLPIDTNPPESMDLPEQQLRVNPPMDPSVYMEPEVKKKVRFSPAPDPPKTISNEQKIMILAVLFFLLFSDTKVKIYLMNILVVMFGDSLRTSGGGTSKIGLLFYSSLFGITLWVAAKLVDLSKV